MGNTVSGIGKQAAHYW